MEKFLDWLCGKSDYTIIRCQKVTKDELRDRIKDSFAECTVLENETKLNRIKEKCTYPKHYIICGGYSDGLCNSIKGPCLIRKN